MGAALQGRRAGDVAVIQTPGGERRMKVVGVE
jgi:transcription elongation GreA/GreB family factor